MMPTRDKLISDWRANLAAAEAEPVSASPRRAWLVRVRTRLYRFLIALYGDGSWRSVAEPPPAARESATVAPDVVFAAADAETLTGKPPKELGRIRAVLKTVAGAQDVRQASGPLAAGLASGEWVVVASELNGLDLAACCRLLSRSGIISRWLEDDRHSTILVPGLYTKRACELIDANRKNLRPRPSPQQVVARASQPPTRLALFLVTAPLIGMISAVLTATAYSDATTTESWSAVAHGLGMFAALSTLIFGVGPIGRLVQRVDRGVSAGISAVWKWRRSARRPRT